MGRETEACLKDFLVEMYVSMCKLYYKLPADICTVEDSTMMNKMYDIISELNLENKVDRKLNR